jgi:hypothetical protein
MSRVATATDAVRKTGRAIALGLARDFRAVPIMAPMVKAARFIRVVDEHNRFRRLFGESPMHHD